MKTLAKVFMLSGTIVSIAFTGAIAAEATDGSVKPGIEQQMETKQEPQSEEKKARKPRSPSDQAARMQARQEKDKVIQEFMNEFRAAERTYNKDKRAASKLPAEEQKTANRKAAEKFEASIQKAEETRDAALEKIEPGRKPRKKKDRDKRTRDRGKKPVKIDTTGPLEGP